MSPFLGEFIGTAILILLGNGVVANVVLNKTKGNNSGWIVITFGWAMGVFTAVYVVGQFSGAHINPAVTVGLATVGLFEWNMVPFYVLSQIAGAAFGSLLVWLSYKDHFSATTDPIGILGCHSTIPAIRNYPSNFMTESIGTVMLMIGVFYLASPGFMTSDGTFLQTIMVDGQDVGFGLGSLSALPVGLLVLGIGLSLGGPTGYAINPARDLGPRIMHSILPIPSKGSSDWAYSWIPIIAPIVGAVLAAFIYLSI
jgi:glycerol uptake facilitator protein